MSRAAHALACLCLVALLGGCAAFVDADQARLCRTILPALNPPDSVVRVLSQTSPAGPPGVRIAYQVTPPGGHALQRTLACGFGGGAQSLERLTLVSVATEHETLDEVQLYFLKRFWLDEPEAFLADPSPVAGADDAPRVPRWLALGLQQGLNALPLAAIYGLLAAAYSLVYGLVGRINLAFGEFAAAGGYAALFGATLAVGGPPLAGVALACVFAVSCATFHGVAVGRAVFRPLARATGQQALVATVGLSLFLQEYLRLTQGAGLRWVSPVLNTPKPVARAENFVVTLTPIAILVALVAAATGVGLVLLMRHGRFGRDWRAYADDPGMSALSGVDPDALFGKTFALASALAGLSGFAITIFYGGVGYGYSTSLGLKALVAAILGGIGSVPGAFLGGLAIGLFEAFWSSAFSISYRDVAVYAILAVLLVFRPGGFLGFGALTPRRV